MSATHRILSCIAAGVALLPGIVAAQCAQSRGITVGPHGRTTSGQPLGLRARIDRAEPIYAVGEGLSLTIFTDREATIEVWELDTNGVLDKLVPAAGKTLAATPGRPLKIPANGERFEVSGPAGVNELHIIARAAPTRGLGASGSLAGNDLREEVRLRYTVVAR